MSMETWTRSVNIPTSSTIRISRTLSLPSPRGYPLPGELMERRRVPSPLRPPRQGPLRPLASTLAEAVRAARKRAARRGGKTPRSRLRGPRSFRPSLLHRNRRQRLPELIQRGRFSEASVRHGASTGRAVFQAELSAGSLDVLAPASSDGDVSGIVSLYAVTEGDH